MLTHSLENKHNSPREKTHAWEPRTFAAWMTLLASSVASLGQGQFVFNNFGADGSPMAPVYGPEIENPHQQKWGNAADANPPGTQVYSGEALDTTFSVEAWYSFDPAADSFALNEVAVVVPNSHTTFLGAGLFGKRAPYIPDTFEPGVYLQVRAWDSDDGRLDSWQEAWNEAQADSGLAVGWSKVFWQPLAYGSLPPEGLRNFESFNLFIVPEPSSVALVCLGGFTLLLLRRHRRE